MVYGNFNNFSPIHRKKRIACSLRLRGIFMIVEWSARAPSAHVMVHSCRKFEEHCCKQYRYNITEQGGLQINI
jgi:hypothetical protein